jgi:hypothetical protein
VDKGSELQLKTDYNRTHPPLDTHGVPASFDDNTIQEETADSHNVPGTGYGTYNQNTFPSSTGTFPGSSSVPSSYGYQQGGSYQQGGTFQQSGTQTWTRGQDPYPMSRSASQPGYYGTAASSSNILSWQLTTNSATSLQYGLINWSILPQCIRRSGTA